MASKDGKQREELHSRWEKAYGQTLSTDEVNEITDNLSEFIRLLLEWQGQVNANGDKQAA